MPATFAHPAFVLPFRPFDRRLFNFTALVIGSVTPDFAYFLRRFDVASYAHSPAGTVLFCIPAGLLAFAVFHVLRVPLCHALPEPHRSALMPLAAARLSLNAKTVLILCLSILLGAWTHAVADSFTHRTGWVVQQVPWMQTTLFHIGQADFPVHQLLQHAGSTLGSIALVGAYVVWLRRQPRRGPQEPDAIGDGTRVLIILGVALIALAIALPLGWQATSHFAGYTRLRATGFQSAIYAMQVFAPLFVASALALYRWSRERNGSL